VRIFIVLMLMPMFMLMLMPNFIFVSCIPKYPKPTYIRVQVCYCATCCGLASVYVSLRRMQVSYACLTLHTKLALLSTQPCITISCSRTSSSKNARW
jgi:hypothetical protein